MNPGKTDWNSDNKQAALKHLKTFEKQWLQRKKNEGGLGAEGDANKIIFILWCTPDNK